MFFIIFTIIIGGILLFNTIFHRTKFNGENALGNLPGNLNNQGLFCEYLDKIYFSNPYDNGSLYVMNSNGTNPILLSFDQVTGINVYGNYIYYTRSNLKKTSNFSFLQFNTHSLCRLDLNGNNLKILDNSPVLSPALMGNYIYYHHYDTTDATTLYRIKIDGKEKEQLSKEPLNPSGISNNGLYYNNTISNLNMCRFDPTTKSKSTVYTGGSYFCVPYENYIYFLNCDKNYTLYRYNLTTNQAEAVTNERVDCYNIYGNYIYYQTASGDESGFYRCEKDGSNPTLIIDGVYTNINVTSKNVYFYKFGQDSPIYCIPTSGELKVTVFQP